MNEISLAVIDGRITTTSNQIAENFGKQHAHVLRAIARLQCSEEFRQSNFGLAEYFDEQGKLRKAYRLTRDGFTFLAMGFTGKEAAQWKEQYIGAFNAMEAELRAQPLPKVGAGGTAARLKALPPPDKVSRALHQAINRKAHLVAVKQYDTIHAIIEDAVRDNLACGASEAECFGYVETYGDLADGTVVANIRDLRELVLTVGSAVDHAGSALAALKRIEKRSGYQLYYRPTKRTPADFFKHDSLVHEVISRMAGEDK